MKLVMTRALVLASLLIASAWSQARQVVYVGSTTELYAAVNDAGNEGAIVILAPGVYALVPNDINAGRLELQRDMELHGTPGHPEDVVIDAGGLPATSFVATAPIAPGAIRTGRGSNAIEWLTVHGAVNGPSAISTDLIAPGGTRVRVAHIVARGNNRGLDVRNPGPAYSGRVIEVEVSDSVFVGHVTGAGQGIRFQNAFAEGASIRAILRGNRSYGNIAGCLAGNVAGRHSLIDIQSFGDRFDGNGNGCVLLAGYGNVTDIAEGNFIQMVAHESSFRDNVGALPAAFPFPGGILAVGGQAVGAPNRAFRNALRMELWGVQMAGNRSVDINAIGAMNTDPGVAGAGNAVEVVLHGITETASIRETASVPEAPGSGNTVTVRR